MCTLNTSDEHFSCMQTFHSVCRIADVLIALQQHGNSDYLGWSLDLPCDMDNVVSELSSQASVMEGDLEEWKKQVSDQRDEYYELNYFSTQQLLSLREELGKFKSACKAEAEVSPKVMAMLQSISPEVTERNVKKQVLAIDANIKKHKRPLEMVNTKSELVQPFAQRQQSRTHVLNEADLAQPTPVAVDEHPEPSSSKQTVVSEIFAAAAHASDSKAAPVPKISMEQLTVNQRSILINIEENCGVPKELILLAFERCERPDVENEIVDWCNGHQEEFQYEDSDTSSQSSASAEESENEVEGETREQVKFQSY